MPIYEYKCADCGEVSEILVLGDEPVTCKHCGGTRIEKLMSAHSAPSVSADSEATPAKKRCCGSSVGCGNPGGFCCS